MADPAPSSTEPVDEESLERRITRLIALVLVVLLGLGLFFSWNQYRANRTDVLQRGKRDAAAAASTVERLLAARVETLNAMSATPAVRFGDRASMKQHFDEFKARRAVRTGVAWIDPAGRVGASSDLALDAGPVDLSDRAYVKRVLATGAPVVSGALISRLDKRPIFIIAAPTFDDNKHLNGLIIWGSRLDQLDSELKSVIRDGHTTVIDADGTIVLGGGSRVSTKADGSFKLSKIRQSDAGVWADATSPTGARRRLISFATVPMAHWVVVRDQSVARMLAPARTSLLIEVVLLALAGTGLLITGARTRRSVLLAESLARASKARAEALRSLASHLSRAVTRAEVAEVMAVEGARTVGAFVVEVAASVQYQPGPSNDVIPILGTEDDPRRSGNQATLLRELLASSMRHSFEQAGPVFVQPKTLASKPPENGLGDNPGDTGSSVSVPLKDSLGLTVGSVGFWWPSFQPFDSDQVQLVEATASMCGQALERAALFDREQAAVERARLLALAVSGLSAAATQADVGHAFARALPVLGCHGGVLAAVDDRIAALEFIHFSGLPGADGQVPDPVPLDGTGPLPNVLRSGRAAFVATVSELKALVGDDLAELLRPHHQSWAALPLVTGGRTIGVMSLMFSTVQRFDDEQRVELTSYAALCGNALARAERGEHDHEVAVALQGSLLPRVPAMIGESRLTGRYQPGTRNVSVGGDWFDAIELDDGRFFVIVGDVVGNGIHSAAAMGKLAMATRALAPLFCEPAALLDQLDKVAQGDPGTQFATMAVVQIDRRLSTLRVSLAGHPPPLLRTEAGQVIALDGARGPSLGGLAHSRSQCDVAIEGPCTLVLYTDGLVEQRTTHLDGRMDVLGRAVANWTGSIDRLADDLLETMLMDGQRDDVALLCVSIPDVLPEFSQTIPATMASVRELRSGLRSWLNGVFVEQEQIDDVLVAVGEAVTNAVEHGHRFDGRDIDVTARRLAPALYRFVISDRGSWRAPQASEGLRGRGLGLMRNLVDTVEVDPGPSGTVVTLTTAVHA